MKKLLLTAITLTLTLLTHAQDTSSQAVIKTEAEYQQEIHRVTNILTNTQHMDELVDMAWDRAPVVLAFDEEMDLYSEEILQQKRNWVSSFRLGLNVFSANTIAGENNQSVTTYGVLPNVGLTLSIDPEKLVNRKSYVRQAEDKRNRSYQLQQGQKELIKTKLIGLHYEYLSSLKAVVIRLHALEARRQYMDAYEIDFKNGTRSFNELLMMQHQLYLAEESVMQEQIQSMKRKSEIDVVLGL